MRRLSKLPPAHVCAAELEKRRKEQNSPQPVQPMLDDRHDPRIPETPNAAIEIALS
jgi:hypothetical protein